MNRLKIGFIVFGGTGDLTKRKLILSFFNLVQTNKISKDSFLIGVGRTDYDDLSYKKHLIDFQKKENKNKIKNLNIHYFKGDVSKPETLNNFEKKLKEIEKTNTSGRIFYLATSFNLFANVLNSVKNCFNHKGFTKIVFEKPIGENLETHSQIEKKLSTMFYENQIFRIDHYLGKKMVANLPNLVNEFDFLKENLNKNKLKSVEIIFEEDLLMGKRINYYNDFGALKDMIQSHLLQVLSLLLIKTKSLNSNEIHKEKEKFLKNIVVGLSEEHKLGQYIEYGRELSEWGLENKKTETYAEIKLYSKLKDYENVFFILKTGKAMKYKYGKIVLNLKDKNIEKIEINIQPSENIIIFYKNKQVKKIEKNYEKLDGYDKMFFEIVDGNNLDFTTFKENDHCWKIIDKIESIKEDIPFIYYKKNENSFIQHKL